MSTTQDVTLDELIGRAEALLPAIADRALQTERDRRIPRRRWTRSRAAGLNRILHPVRYGGYGLDYDAFFEISWRLSSACGSTGWVYSVASVHHWQLGLATGAGAGGLLRGGTSGRARRSTRVARSSSRSTAATSSPVAGSTPAAACMPTGAARAFIPESRRRSCCSSRGPTSASSDTWHVSGLKGTGSNDVVIDDPVFVPGYRMVPWSGVNPEAVATHGRGSYGAPVPSLIPGRS